VTPESFDFYVELKAFTTALLKDLGHERGIKVIDVSAYFESFSGSQRVALFEDEMHFSDAGAREVAEAIYQSLATDAAIGPGAPVPSLNVVVPGGR